MSTAPDRRTQRLEAIHAIAASLGESLVIQSRTYCPQPGDAALALCKNSTDARWCQALMRRATAMCLVTGRTVWPLQGSLLFYFGHNVTEFKRLCLPIGRVTEVRS